MIFTALEELQELPASTVTDELGDAEALADVEVDAEELLLLLLAPLLHAASAVAAARPVIPTTASRADLFLVLLMGGLLRVYLTRRRSTPRRP
jgi:hypothetical protein